MSSDSEISGKRKKSSHDFQVPRKLPSSDDLADENDTGFLSLSLSLCPADTRTRHLSPVYHPQQQQLPPAPPPPPPSPAVMQFEPFFQQPLSTTTLPPPPPPPPPPPHHQAYPLCMPPMPVTRPGHNNDTLAAAPPIVQSAAAAAPHRGQHQPTTGGPIRPNRQRRNQSQEPREAKMNEPVLIPPFPWATTQRATIHTLDYLVSKQILNIGGEVHCKRCDRKFEMEFDLRQNFVEVGTFIAQNKSNMHDRAPGVWMNPVLPACKLCEEDNCVKPIIPEDKDAINWLFLLLGQLLGCCTLEQLKYFCKHTKNHRTGAKDRVLFLTYLTLCKQLDPNGPFDR
ncbi:OLC1v1003168C1 [Oldenlandia corymbosa var. corymbosa]|uniref:OLC1v1003168C1 n=1 Tax=Oldenlandia corymbosa var. corymbosa TaxID=529605 RepID=A0AAV1DCT3_OLDCO|nr:OLC1v1003168C1 [Oldenlandia corymbosa var. corymbosa]